MSEATLIPLSAVVINLAVTILVLSRGVSPSIKRAYALWGASICVWNTGTVFMFWVKDREIALFWARFLQFGVIFLPVALFHLVLLVAQTPRPRLLRVMYGIHLALAVANCTPFFVSGVEDVGYAYYSNGGPVFFLFAASYVFLTWTSLIVLHRKRRSTDQLHRARITALFAAVGILIAFGNNDLLPILGVYKYPFTNIPIFPFGSLAAIVYGLLTGYSVLQHHMLDVQVALSRFTAHAIRVLFMCIVGLALLLLLLVVPQSELTIRSLLLSVAVVAVSGITASLLFPRLFGKGVEGLERRIMGDQFEYHDQIRTFISSIQWYGDTDLLLHDLHDLLTRTVLVRSYQIILPNETGRVFVMFRSFPEEPIRELPELDEQAPIFRYFESTGAEYLAVSLSESGANAGELERGARKFLDGFGASFCLPFMTGDEPFGLMLIGPKVNHDPYTATDISLMVSLARHLSLIINQLRLKTQIQHTQELELLGRMSRGMAHDLNNLVTPVWTLVQLLNEGLYDEELRQQLVPMAFRNVQAIRAYIRDSLFFSEHARPNLQLGRLDVLINQAVGITAGRCAGKQINVVVETPGEVLVEMDEVLIQRLIANVISNAADASPPHSTIRLELVRLLKTEAHRDWYRLRIIDSGEGIAPENLQRIFKPFFTTKDRGDAQRGFGLGLSICRKIVQLHGGQMEIFSQLHKGTTVQIDLPSRQIAKPEMTMMSSVS